MFLSLIKDMLDKDKIESAILSIENVDFDSITIEDLKGMLRPMFDGYTMTVPQYPPVVHIFRGRVCSKPETLGEISYPPAKFIKSYGRANDIGQSMFYGCVGRAVPFYELHAEVGDTLIMSLWRTKKTMTVNHVGFTPEAFIALNSNRDLSKMEQAYAYVETTLKHSDLNGVVYNYLASVFTKRVPAGNNNYYKLSIAITNLLTDSDILDGIVYPTVAMSGNADNVILKPEFVDDGLEFVNVQFCEVTQKDGDSFSFEILDTAVSVDAHQRLQWTGKTLSWEGNDTATFQEQDNSWWAKDQQGNYIYPTADGNPIIPLSPLGRRFRDAFSGTFKASQEVMLTAPGENIPTKVDLHLSFDPPERFLSFYIPAATDPESACVALFNNIDQYLTADKEIQLGTKNADGSIKITNENLMFSGKIYCFSESRFSPDRLLDQLPEAWACEFFFPDL